MNIILLHGTDGSAQSNWIPWLKLQLEERGHMVFAPSLPDAAYPNGDKWSDFVINNAPFALDENTLVVGHSAGAALIPMFLQKLPEGVRIKKAILVSGFCDTLGWDKLKDLQNVTVDYERVRSKAAEIIQLHSDNDPYVPLDNAKSLGTKLGSKFRVIKGQGHFNLGPSPKYKEFPKLLAIILQEDALKQLYLMSSFRGQGVAKMVMSDAEKKLGKSADEIKVLYITTAGNLHRSEERIWIDEGRKILVKHGWQVADYDIANKSEAEVKEAVAGQDVVFVQGGQCIYMLEQAQNCNFAKVIKSALARGVIYLGESTGSIITGRDISPYRFLAKDRRENPPELENYNGLGLVNFLVRPHWNHPEKREKYLDIMREHLDEFYNISEPIITLNDDQLIYVEGDQFQIWEGEK